MEKSCTGNSCEKWITSYPLMGNCGGKHIQRIHHHVADGQQKGWKAAEMQTTEKEIKI